MSNRRSNWTSATSASLKCLLHITLLLLFSLQTLAQSLRLGVSSLTLPEGYVIGAGFFEQRDLLFVQQKVLSTTKDDPVLYARRLSAWSLKNKSALMERMLDPNPSNSRTVLCGRVEVSEKIRKVLLCSSKHYLDMIDPDTLETVGKLGLRSDQDIADFAVDDVRGQVAVLAAERGLIRLAVYSLLDGSLKREQILPSLPDLGMQLAVVSKTGQLVAALPFSTRGNIKSDIYLCDTETASKCLKIARINEVSQMSLLGNELLGAVNEFPDSKKDCLINVELKTFMVARGYCAPKTGVHNAVGVVNDQYVAAFTGIGKRIWWKEENVLVENSFSVWRVEDSKVVAVARDPANFGGQQSEIQIFPRRTAPVFVAAVGLTNVLYVFSIDEETLNPADPQGRRSSLNPNSNERSLQ
jgi:hypothetical protein